MTTILTDNDKLVLAAAIELLEELSDIAGNRGCNDHHVANTDFNWEIVKQIDEEAWEDAEEGNDRPTGKRLSTFDISWIGAIKDRIEELRTRNEARPISAPLSTVDAETGEG